jgi:hypothetical protein
VRPHTAWLRKDQAIHFLAVKRFQSHHTRTLGRTVYRPTGLGQETVQTGNTVRPGNTHMLPGKRNSPTRNCQCPALGLVKAGAHNGPSSGLGPGPCTEMKLEATSRNQMNFKSWKCYREFRLSERRTQRTNGTASRHKARRMRLTSRDQDGNKCFLQ